MSASSRDLVPAATQNATVVGTVEIADGELVVRVRPSRVHDATERLLNDERTEKYLHPLARTCLTYVGPLSSLNRLMRSVVVCDTPVLQGD
ncbi:MAG: hypothetical protein M3460_28190 [Actinomycetota bacterium]|nr:hypothetical protein [Actinomycetota bacterium]